MKNYTLSLLFILLGFAAFAQDSDQSTPTDTAVSAKVLERHPIYPGCDPNLTTGEQSECFNQMIAKHIRDNFNYPKEAKEAGIQGKVYVNFTINKEGKVVDIKVARGADPLLDQEAIRIFSLLPNNFTPGILEGEAVKVSFTAPLNFMLGESTPKKKGKKV